MASASHLAMFKMWSRKIMPRRVGGLLSLLSEARVERSAMPLNSWSGISPSVSQLCYPHCDELLDIECVAGTATVDT